MNDLDRLFKSYLSATQGDKEARWELIEYYQDYIDYVSEYNEELKHIIILALYGLFDNLNYRFDKFFKEIN